MSVWRLIVLESWKKLFSSGLFLLLFLVWGFFRSWENECLLQSLVIAITVFHWGCEGSRFPLAGEGLGAGEPSCPFCLYSCSSASSLISHLKPVTKCILCLGRLGPKGLPGRTEVWSSCQALMPSAQWLIVCIALPFPVIFPVSCVPHVVSIKVRVWGKGSMWIAAVFTLPYHSKARSALCYRACTGLQAMHEGRVGGVNCTAWKAEISLLHPFKMPWPPPFLTPSCTTVTLKWMRTRSSIQLKGTRQSEQIIH